MNIVSRSLHRLVPSPGHVRTQVKELNKILPGSDVLLLAYLVVVPKAPLLQPALINRGVHPYLVVLFEQTDLVHVVGSELFYVVVQDLDLVGCVYLLTHNAEQPEHLEVLLLVEVDVPPLIQHVRGEFLHCG